MCVSALKHVKYERVMSLKQCWGRDVESLEKMWSFEQQGRVYWAELRSSVTSGSLQSCEIKIIINVHVKRPISSRTWRSESVQQQNNIMQFESTVSSLCFSPAGLQLHFGGGAGPPQPRPFLTWPRPLYTRLLLPGGKGGVQQRAGGGARPQLPTWWTRRAGRAESSWQHRYDITDDAGFQ